MNCKQATLLIEKREEEKIGLFALVKLRYHLTICKACSFYREQSRLLSQALSKKADQIPSQELAELEKRVLKKVLDNKP